jgi:hypothetical protein
MIECGAMGFCFAVSIVGRTMKYDFTKLGGQYVSGFQMTIAFLPREWRFIAMPKSINCQNAYLAPTLNRLFIDPHEFTLCVLDM